MLIKVVKRDGEMFFSFRDIVFTNFLDAYSFGQTTQSYRPIQFVHTRNGAAIKKWAIMWFTAGHSENPKFIPEGANITPKYVGGINQNWRPWSHVIKAEGAFAFDAFCEDDLIEISDTIFDSDENFHRLTRFMEEFCKRPRYYEGHLKFTDTCGNFRIEHKD